MSFSSQRDVHYLVDQFHYWLLIRYMKLPAMLKRQRFEDSGSDKTEPRGSKCQGLDQYDDEKGNSLDDEEENGLNKDGCEIENGRYVPSWLL